MLSSGRVEHRRMTRTSRCVIPEIGSAALMEMVATVTPRALMRAEGAYYHVAFATEDPDGSRAAPVGAEATFVNETAMPDGSRLLMLRDPRGIALQLCKRATPLI